MLPADDKARELYNKFYSSHNAFPATKAKEYAMKCVDQIIEEVKLIYNGSYPNYWDYVKEEINAL
jgi:hypothetical protein